MSIINDDEILARVHKYKLFRREGNLFIDLYESLLGEPQHKYIAVPNSLIQEADKKYFGIGDSKKSALLDCLKKIKDVPIVEILPPESLDDLNIDFDRKSKPKISFGKFDKVFDKFSTSKKMKVHKKF